MQYPNGNTKLRDAWPMWEANDREVKQQITAHEADQSNPHNVTAAQVGAETPAGAQAKADAVQSNLDAHEADTIVHVTEAEHEKLDGIQAGAEVNQNAFAQVNGITAGNPSDELTIEGSTGITVTTNPATKKVILTATGEATPGPHGPSHDPDGPDPIPALDQVIDDVSDLSATVADNTDAISDLAGAGRTTETVKGNADDIAAVSAEVAAQKAEFEQFETETNDKIITLQYTKADKSYVDDKIADIGDGSPKDVYATLADLQAAFPSGTQGVYVITADGKWYYWSGSAWTAGGTYQSTGIADGSITPPKLSFPALSGVIGKNLFNKATAADGFYVSASDGSLQPLGTTSASDYIPVTPNAKYVLSGTSEQLAFYNASKVFVSGVPFPGGAILTAPPTAAFVRLSMLTAQKNNVQFEAGEVVTPYEGYGYKLDNNQIDYRNINFIKNSPVAPIKIIVKKDGTGHFTDVRAANNSISDSSASKPYLIEVHDGVYAYGTSTMDWKVKPYTTIRGVSKERVHIKGEQPDNASLASIEEKSTIFLDATSSLENLTITVKNGRYPVHCEAAGLNPNTEYNIKNCHIEHLGNQGARKWQQDNGGNPSAVWQSETAWGYGSASGIVQRFRDVTFLGNSYSFYVHNNKNFVTACEHYLENCRIAKKRIVGASGETIRDGFAIRLDCLGSLRNDKVYINDSEVTGTISMGDNPWIPTDDKSQLARHAEIDLVVADTDALPFVENLRSRALRISSGSGTVLSLSGDAVSVLFGQPTYFNGMGGLLSYVYGNLDISGIKTGMASDTDSKNTLGRRLGDCTSVNKTLIVTKDGSSRSITFDQNYTVMTNASILAAINSELNGFATAEEMMYDRETYYPQFLSAQKNLQNTSAVGIERGSVVAYSGDYGIRKMTSADSASLFAGIVIEPINPGSYGRVLTRGRIHRNYLINLPTGLSFGDTLIIGTPGEYAKGTGEVVGKAITNDIIQFG